MSDPTVNEYAYTYKSPTAQRADGGLCLWYRSRDDSYDLIRIGNQSNHRWHVFDAQNGEYMQAFSTWESGREWIEERLRAA